MAVWGPTPVRTASGQGGLGVGARAGFLRGGSMNEGDATVQATGTRGPSTQVGRLCALDSEAWVGSSAGVQRPRVGVLHGSLTWDLTVQSPWG